MEADVLYNFVGVMVGVIFIGVLNAPVDEIVNEVGRTYKARIFV